ncbi:MAG: FlgK family flagellar hook-associated protein, partial [Janthinobacterium lividum]
AGTLEDQRQSAIGQLSQLVGLDQIVTENNGISLTTAGGVPLVSGNTASQLSTVQTGSTTEVRDASGKDVSGALTGGSVGGLLTAQNVDLPAVSGSLDALAYRVATAVNAQNSAGVLSNGSAGGALFAVTSTAAGAAAAISVSATDASAVAAAGVGEGASGTTNALALSALGTATDASGQTVAQQLASLLSAVGTQSASVSALNTTQSATVAQLTSTRDSESAVSLDDEAANLSIYQRSYDAAAKLFSIADSIMTTALNLGEATTVS